VGVGSESESARPHLAPKFRRIPAALEKSSAVG